MLRWIPLLLALLACSDAAGGGPAGGATDPSGGSPAVRLREVAAGLDRPLHLTAPAGDERLFVVEQPGRIRIIRDGRVLPTPFLDITDRVGSGGERGLLGLAFHPDYRSNGWFFVNYTGLDGATRVDRFRVGADPDRADPTSARGILYVEQPFANHNGGLVAFGPDGMLYVGMGDGGSGGDPLEHGQNPGTLLGALLRLDVDAGEPYAIPRDNPYVDTPGARGEIWAIGLRNPWRFAWDHEAGLLYVADVGQNRWEEVTVVPADRGGVNYGWNIMEGRHCYLGSNCDRAGLELPVLEYSHDDGCSVTGGHVYRGRALPALHGHYFYSDFCGGWLRSFRYADGQARDAREWEVGDLGRVLSFGEDAAGELYVLSADGRVRKIVP